MELLFSTAKNRKSFIIDIWQDSKYASGFQFYIQFTRVLWSRTKLPKCKKGLIKTSRIHIARTKNIVFQLSELENFPSHASVGTEVLLFLATVLFLIGRLHTRFCRNEIFLIFLGFKLFSNSWANPYTMFLHTWYQGSLYLCGESNLGQNLTTFQNIMSSIVGVYIFPHIPVKFNYLEIYFISGFRNLIPKKKSKKALFSSQKTKKKLA